MQHREGVAGYSAGVTAAPLACVDVPLRVGCPVCIAPFAGGGRWRGVRGGASTAVVRSTLKNSCRLTSSRDNGCGNARAVRSDPRAARNLPVETSPRVPARARGAFLSGLLFPQQKLKRRHGRSGMCFATEHLANAAGISAQPRDDFRVAYALVVHDVCRDGLNEIQSATPDFHFIQRHTRYRVFDNCHGFFLPCGDVTGRCFKLLPVDLVGLFSGPVALSGSRVLTTARSGHQTYHDISVNLPAFSTQNLRFQNPLTRQVSENSGFCGSEVGKIHVSRLADSQLTHLNSLTLFIQFGVRLLLQFVSCLRGCVWRGGDTRVAGGDSASFEVAL